LAASEQPGRQKAGWLGRRLALYSWPLVAAGLVLASVALALACKSNDINSTTNNDGSGDGSCPTPANLLAAKASCSACIMDSCGAQWCACATDPNTVSLQPWGGKGTASGCIALVVCNANSCGDAGSCQAKCTDIAADAGISFTTTDQQSNQALTTCLTSRIDADCGCY